MDARFDERCLRSHRQLHPLIDRRDVLSIAYTNLYSHLQSLLKDTTRAEAEVITALKKNKELTTVFLDGVEGARVLQDNITKDLRLKAELVDAREATTTARKRWRIMKSVVGAIIAGSGVDWARDDTLRNLVLDDEDEVD